MASQETNESLPVEVPEDATVIKPSGWAWILPALPWIILLAASMAFDFISFGALPAIFMAIVVVPRYLRWKGTAYILTDKHIIIQIGGLRGSQQFDLLISGIQDVLVKPGLLGGLLGYRNVNLTLDDDRIVVLPHVPDNAPLAAYVESRIAPKASQDLSM